jgi:isopenicillin N synthase-like dioxygenase
MSKLSIPVIDLAALFDGPSPARARTDAGIMEAASTFGFFCLEGLRKPCACLELDSTAPTQVSWTAGPGP